MFATTDWELEMVAAFEPEMEEPPPWRPRPQLSVVRPTPTYGSPPGRVEARRGPAVYRRRRVAAVALLSLLAFGVPAGAGRLLGAWRSLGAPPAAAHRVVVVQPGDTLWGIALQAGVKGDVRPFVAALETEVHGRPLQVGERITLP